jgi:putative transposase
MLAGAPVHVIQRGNNRSACFVSDQDRAFYLFHLSRALERFGCALHAYCLMTNHVHLLLTPDEEESCGLLMKQVGQLHSQYFNKLYRRSGSLWEGRFRSCLVQCEVYLLTCYCYIELNPVRAGLVQHPGEYRWSSYSVNISGRPEGFITAHPEYLRLGLDRSGRASAYASLVRSQADCAAFDEIRAATNGGHPLGDTGFSALISAALGRQVDETMSVSAAGDGQSVAGQRELGLSVNTK